MHVLPDRKLDFLWLELTNRCNLQCVHCYTESHPHSGDRDLLMAEDYESIMRQAFALGCRKLQFIGGEPQLNRAFPRLLAQAKTIGFEFIEVFTNLTVLDNKTVAFAAANGIRFATSVYSCDAAAHDAITRVSSSHERTIANLKKLIANGIETRAAVIRIDQDAAMIDRTKRFLRDLGVRNFRDSATREFGRGERVVLQKARLSGLCGHCWNGKLCVAPDGAAYPCVMARQWPVGNLRNSPLAAIVEGQPLGDMRQTIFETVWLPKVAAAHVAASQDCTPYEDPAKKPGETPDLPTTTCDPCPQSCIPTDDFHCGPHACPQSCSPFIVVCEPTGNE